MSEESNRLTGLMNRRLRRWLQASNQRTDELFRALCKINPQAEAAMGELWGSGAFDCGPQDYDFIVKRCLKMLGNASRTNPIA